MCASKDKHFNRYYTTIRKQNPRTEILVDGEVDNISLMVDEVYSSLLSFPSLPPLPPRSPRSLPLPLPISSNLWLQIMREIKKFPRHVLFYRDGVGEGMYDKVIHPRPLPLSRSSSLPPFLPSSLPHPLPLFIHLLPRPLPHRLIRSKSWNCNAYA
jgi:hypothetical protein